MKNLFRIISLALLIFGLQGCGALRLAYNQAPVAAYWYLDDYLDFNDAQRPLVKAALRDIHQWHRQTQLPAFVDTLQKLQRQMPQDMNSAQACDLYDEVQVRLRNTFEGMPGLTSPMAKSANPQAVQVLATLDRAQLTHLERRFAKSNLAYRKDYVAGTPQRLHAHRLKQAVSRAEMLYGNLEDRQASMLSARLAQSAFDPEMTYVERLRRQQDVLETLRAIAGMAAVSTDGTNTVMALNAATDVTYLQQRLGDIISRIAQSPEPRYHDYAQKLRQQSCQNFADLHNSMSPAQRLKALAKLQDYELDLRALMIKN
jgi:hypothetical protein